MRLASAWSVVFLIAIGASFFLKAGELYSRVWLGTYFVSGLLALLLSRKILYYIVRRWTQEGRLTRRTVIVRGPNHPVCAADFAEACEQYQIEDAGVVPKAIEMGSKALAVTARALWRSVQGG